MKRGLWPMIVVLALAFSACAPAPRAFEDTPTSEATATPTMVGARRAAPLLREAERKNETALRFHRRRCLKDASQAYEEVLRLDPPRPPSPAELKLAKRFAPRLYVTPNEPFILEDFAVIIHPDKPFIAYHMFWDDDIDYPADNDPTDHEVVWVKYDPASLKVTGVCAYYHGRILSTEEAVEDARAHAQRPRIEVQWGKHGSLPVGWEEINGGSILRDMKRTYERLHEEGHRLPDHPLARGWPRKFEGSWEDFTNFSKLVDPLKLIEAKGMVAVSRWNNAVIDQYFLPYNFYPKQEWP